MPGQSEFFSGTTRRRISTGGNTRATLNVNQRKGNANRAVEAALKGSTHQAPKGNSKRIGQASAHSKLVEGSGSETSITTDFTLSHKTKFNNLLGALEHLENSKKKYDEAILLRSTRAWVMDNPKPGSTSGKRDVDKLASGFVFFRPTGVGGGVGSEQDTEYIVSSDALNDRPYFASSVDTKGKPPESQFTPEEISKIKKQWGFKDAHTSSNSSTQKQTATLSKTTPAQKRKTILEAISKDKTYNSEIGIWWDVKLEHINEIRVKYSKGQLYSIKAQLEQKTKSLLENKIAMSLKNNLSNKYLSITFKEHLQASLASETK